LKDVPKQEDILFYTTDTHFWEIWYHIESTKLLIGVTLRAVT